VNFSYGDNCAVSLKLQNTTCLFTIRIRSLTELQNTSYYLFNPPTSNKITSVQKILRKECFIDNICFILISAVCLDFSITWQQFDFSGHCYLPVITYGDRKGSSQKCLGSKHHTNINPESISHVCVNFVHLRGTSRAMHSFLVACSITGLAPQDRFYSQITLKQSTMIKLHDILD
jgi:hypothetical protein